MEKVITWLLLYLMADDCINIIIYLYLVQLYILICLICDCDSEPIISRLISWLPAEIILKYILFAVFYFALSSMVQTYVPLLIPYQHKISTYHPTRA